MEKIQPYRFIFQIVSILLASSPNHYIHWDPVSSSNNWEAVKQKYLNRFGKDRGQRLEMRCMKLKM